MLVPQGGGALATHRPPGWRPLQPCFSASQTPEKLHLPNYLKRQLGSPCPRWYILTLKHQCNQRFKQPVKQSYTIMRSGKIRGAIVSHVSKTRKDSKVKLKKASKREQLIEWGPMLNPSSAPCKDPASKPNLVFVLLLLFWYGLTAERRLQSQVWRALLNLRFTPNFHF